MPSWMKLVGGWVIAAVVAVAFSWGAVSQVRNRVIQPSIEIPTTVAAAAATNSPQTTTTIASPTVIRVEPEIIEDTATTQPATDTTSTPTTTPTTTAQQDAATTTTTAAPATTTTSTTTTQPPPTTTSTTTTAPPQTETSSYQLSGGTVTISHSPGVVTFVSAIPQADFSTELRETGPERVRVRFESETHTSDFRAEWEGSELKIIQNETGDD